MKLATKRRAAVAPVVYLAQDRLDLGVAAVELAKTMAIPRDCDDECLKRVARYLHGQLDDYLQWYPVQEDMETVVLNTVGHVQRGHIDRDSAVGESSHRRIELGSNTHSTGFW